MLLVEKQNMLSTKVEVISDNQNDDIQRIHTRLYSGHDDTLAICIVNVDKKGVAEIYTIAVLNEADKRKHFGSKLWQFTENYVISKHKPNRFVGELDFSYFPAVSFWKSLNFQLVKDTIDYGHIIKEI